jgi:hypothetical protein
LASRTTQGSPVRAVYVRSHSSSPAAEYFRTVPRPVAKSWPAASKAIAEKGSGTRITGCPSL